MKKACSAFSIIILAVLIGALVASVLPAPAQTATHSVVFTWSAESPSTTTYTAFRAAGSCAGANNFAKYATISNPTTGTVVTWTDTAVTGGLTYCYWFMSSNNMYEGGAEITMPMTGSVTLNPPGKQSLVATYQ